MTIRIPTSSAQDPAALQLPDPAALQLPDPVTLARLANEFFAALPAVRPAPPPDVAAVTSQAESGLAVAREVGSATAPDAVLHAGKAVSGPPIATAPAAPADTPPRVHPPSYTQRSPYYFLDEFGTPASSPARTPATGDDRIAALPFAMPGAGALRDLLGGLAGQPGQDPTAPTARGVHFYFLDPLAAAAREGSAPVFRDPHPPFDVQALRRDFPILQERVHGRPLVWLDNAATTHKPQAVIDRLSYFYAHENSNIHRAAHELAARATDAYEAARNTVARFLGASSAEEIIFVRGATEAINLVANSWGRRHIGAGDEIIVSHLEHHANIVPWQQLAAERGARLRVIPVDDSGQILLDEYQRLLNARTRLVAITHVSNALGTVVPVHEVVELAHRAGAIALVDGAQSVSHMPIDVQAIGADFFVFSGHKVFGPTGIGVVYGRREVLADSPPWQGGGNMIADVTFEHTRFQDPPTRFEAGTGNIADAVGLGAAIDYLSRIGLPNVARYEHELLAYATQALCPVPGLHLIGTARDKASVLSFVLDGYAPQEIGTALNEDGIAVRAGHHCAQPILRRFGLEATVRASLAFYNTCEEVDALARALHRLATGR